MPGSWSPTWQRWSGGRRWARLLNRLLDSQWLPGCPGPGRRRAPAAQRGQAAGRRPSQRPGERRRIPGICPDACATWARGRAKRPPRPKPRPRPRGSATDDGPQGQGVGIPGGGHCRRRAQHAGDDRHRWLSNPTGVCCRTCATETPARPPTGWPTNARPRGTRRSHGGCCTWPPHGPRRKLIVSGHAQVSTAKKRPRPAAARRLAALAGRGHRPGRGAAGWPARRRLQAGPGLGRRAPALHLPSVAPVTASARLPSLPIYQFTNSLNRRDGLAARACSHTDRRRR